MRKGNSQHPTFDVQRAVFDVSGTALALYWTENEIIEEAEIVIDFI
jgi:hypothetical protein